MRHDAVLCHVCERGVVIPEWPTHAVEHGRAAFCGRGAPGGVSPIIVCRRLPGHKGLCAGALGELKWEVRERPTPTAED